MKIRRVMNQPFVYWVTSESDPSKEHCVRWLERSCSCNSYAYKNHASLQSTGRPFCCKHMEATREEEWDSIIETVKSEQLAQ